ncbi:YPDG domain-containing protein, partial [Streptococcus suis]
EPGTEVKVPAPTNPDGTPVPDGSTFVSDNPAIVVDPNTGEVTVTIPEDATPGTVIDGTITITYPDGSTDEVPVKVTVKDPNATDADNNDPKYTDGSGEPGTEVKVPAPTNPDGSKVPDGSKFESNNPNVVVDPNTGEVTVKIPSDAKPGDVIEAVITITYPDGSTDEVPVKITVTESGKSAVTDNQAPTSTPTVAPVAPAAEVKASDAAKSAVLPNTGQESNSATVVAGAALLFVGLAGMAFAARKRKEENESL